MSKKLDKKARKICAARLSAAEARMSAVEGELRNARSLFGLTGESLEQSDVVGAIVELARKNETLAEDVKALTRKDAEAVVQRFIDEGRLLARAKKRAVEVYLSEGLEGIEPFLAPEDSPYIRMQPYFDFDAERQHDFDIDCEIDRLSEVAARVSGAPNRPGR